VGFAKNPASAFSFALLVMEAVSTVCDSTEATHAAARRGSGSRSGVAQAAETFGHDAVNGLCPIPIFHKRELARKLFDVCAERAPTGWTMFEKP
jgi:hypothetical protein